MSEPTGLPADRTIVIGTASPTRCGIATYTTNLTLALRGLGVVADVLRIVDGHHDGIEGNPVVTALWCLADPHGIASAAETCDMYDSVLLQHEFGIYPGPDGEGVVELVRQIDRPVVTVLHTVLTDPDHHQRAIVDELLDRSRAVVVHGSAARSRLLATHDVDASRVHVVPHGATAVDAAIDPGPTAPPFALTYGLLGPGKGIEHAIEAIALLRESGTDLHYLVAGATHPAVLAHEGERYRERLQRTARVLGVDDLVAFDDRYRTASQQAALTADASVIVLPYDSREQVTSGVLVEAVAAGRPVVATAFPHAVELAPTGAVAVVPHGSSTDLANALFRAAVDMESARRMRRCARSCGTDHDWSTVARSFAAILRRTTERAEVGR